MKHLILVGACYVDTILSVPHFPEEDSKLRASKLEVRRGGNCPNTLEVLRQLLVARHPGEPVLMPHLVSPLPGKNTPATAEIVSSFGPAAVPSSSSSGAAAPIDLSTCLYREGHAEPASSYVIRSQASGSRTIVNYNDLPEMTVDEFASIASRFRDEPDCWWHFEGRIPDVTLKCIQHLRRHLPRSKVSVEVEKPSRAGLRELAAEADVVFYSKSWAEHEGYASPDSCLGTERPGRASLVLCTWGAAGAVSLPLPDGDRCDCSALPIEDVVDTVGAGDTFTAGILYGLTCCPDWGPRRLKFAVDLATFKVQMHGFGGVAGRVASY